MFSVSPHCYIKRYLGLLTVTVLERLLLIASVNNHHMGEFQRNLQPAFIVVRPPEDKI